MRIDRQANLSFPILRRPGRTHLPVPLRRSGHALKMTFLTYTRNGRETLDLPQLAGAYGSSMIEATWWPHHYTALAQGVQTGHIEVGFIGAEHLFQEFSPEFKRLLHLRAAPAPAAP